MGGTSLEDNGKCVRECGRRGGGLAQGVEGVQGRVEASAAKQARARRACAEGARGVAVSRLGVQLGTVPWCSTALAKSLQPEPLFAPLLEGWPSPSVGRPGFRASRWAPGGGSCLSSACQLPDLGLGTQPGPSGPHKASGIVFFRHSGPGPGLLNTLLALLPLRLGGQLSFGPSA